MDPGAAAFAGRVAGPAGAAFSRAASAATELRTAQAPRADSAARQGFQNLNLLQNGDNPRSTTRLLPERKARWIPSGANEAFLVNGSLSQGVLAQPGDAIGLGGPGVHLAPGLAVPAGNPFGATQAFAAEPLPGPTLARWPGGGGRRRRQEAVSAAAAAAVAVDGGGGGFGGGVVVAAAAVLNPIATSSSATHQSRARQPVPGKRLLHDRQLCPERPAVLVHIAHLADRRGTAQGRLCREPLRILRRRPAVDPASVQQRQDVLVRELHRHAVEERLRQGRHGSDGGGTGRRFLRHSERSSTIRSRTLRFRIM